MSCAHEIKYASKLPQLSDEIEAKLFAAFSTL